MKENLIVMEFEALPENQGFARAIVSSYMAFFDPTVEELTELKTAVSEAVSNSIMHGYEKKGCGKIRLEMRAVSSECMSVKIIDYGKGILDIEKAREPMFSTVKNEELSGMGFTVMESFTDKILVESEVGKGTAVTLIKKIDNSYGF